MKYKVIAIAGKAGSGKDALLKGVLGQNPNLHEIISCTTRPKRDNEEEGVNYYYLTSRQLADKILANEMLETTCFNGWYYGTPISSLDPDKINVGVFNPAGITELAYNDNIDLVIIYVQASDKIRLTRQLNREVNPNVKEIVRRFSTDEEDFKNFKERFDPIHLDNEVWEDYGYCVNEILDVVYLVETGQIEYNKFHI